MTLCIQMWKTGSMLCSPVVFIPGSQTQAGWWKVPTSIISDIFFRSHFKETCHTMRTSSHMIQTMFWMQESFSCWWVTTQLLRTWGASLCSRWCQCSTLMESCMEGKYCMLVVVAKMCPAIAHSQGLAQLPIASVPQVTGNWARASILHSGWFLE